MIHERYRLRKWVKEFPLSRLSEYSFGLNLAGPGEMAIVEQIRDEVRATGADLGPLVPVDVCIWNLGEAPTREVTKIGGVPFWPADEPWPTYEGRPYTFVAQFCFADSRDIVRKLPADILVLLANADDYRYWSFHWFDLDETDLLDPDEIPEPGWEIQPCYATLHRTVEYPQANYEFFENYRGPCGFWARRFYSATKIGGHWMLRGEIPDPEEEKDPVWKRRLKKAWESVRRAEREFICQLHSISFGATWPFLNVSSHRSKELRRAKNFLCIHDVGVVDFFYNGKEVREAITGG